MGMYTNQANQYHHNSNEIKNILNNVVSIADGVTNQISKHKSINDFMTEKIKDQNENIKNEIAKIIKKMDDTSSKLINKAKEIDARIEEENLRRLKEEQEKDNIE